MLFNSLSFAIFLPLAFVACGLTTYTPQGYRGGVRPDSAPIAFGAFDRLDSFEIPTATSLSLLGFAAVASCLDLGCLPRRGVEIVERARLGEVTQSPNLDSRRFGAGKSASQIGRHRIVADFLHVLPLYTAK